VSSPPIIISVSPPRIAIDRYNTTLATGTDDAIAGPSKLPEFDHHVREGSTTMQSNAQIETTTRQRKKVFEVGKRKPIVFDSHVCQPRFVCTLFGELQGISLFVNQYKRDLLRENCGQGQTEISAAVASKID
jgi:hypothetical protein